MALSNGVLNRLIVRNGGNVPLTDVVVTDPTLGITHTVGTLGVGAPV